MPETRYWWVYDSYADEIFPGWPYKSSRGKPYVSLPGTEEIHLNMTRFHLVSPIKAPHGENP